ncbi:hypothetical protein GCM10010344_58000 [Streptomyces bluensis]|nr:hypothetical protein GCM10010344_58000 [Streptomyces bluensis]
MHHPDRGTPAPARLRAEDLAQQVGGAGRDPVHLLEVRGAHDAAECPDDGGDPVQGPQGEPDAAQRVDRGGAGGLAPLVEGDVGTEPAGVQDRAGPVLRG